MEYKQKLGDVDATLSTTNKLLNVGDPKKWMGLIVTFIILTVFLLLLLFLVKKYVKNEAGNLWDFIVRPFRSLAVRYEAAEAINKTGTKPTLSEKEAQKVADGIYGCFQSSGDDEDSLYNYIRNKIQNAADWELVKVKFGVRPCPKVWAIVGVKHDGDLEHIISDNLSSKERAYVHSLLDKKGIKTII